MDPGAGTSVQCLSAGMLLLAGMAVSVSFVVGERFSWWEEGTQRTVLMGAMIRLDGLLACGVGTAMLVNESVLDDVNLLRRTDI